MLRNCLLQRVETGLEPAHHELSRTPPDLWMIYGGQAHGGFCKIPFCCNCAHSVDGRHGDVTDAVEAGAAGQRRDGAEQPGGLAQLGRSARQQHGRAQAPGRRLVSGGLRSVRGPAC